MTGFFEIFNPGQRHTREQKDFDKIAVVPSRKGARGPMQIDLDAGTVVLPARKHLSEQAVESIPDGGQAAERPPEESAAAESPTTEAQGVDPQRVDPVEDPGQA